MNGEKNTATIEITPELLERAKAKDRDALTDLYHASSLELYRTVHALVRDEELARDVQQDAYLQAFSHLDQLRDPSSFLPWLRQIAVNEARAKLRKNRPLLFSELFNEEDAEEPVIPDLRPEAQPEAALDRKETTRLVREILNGMPDGQRLIVGMYYYEQIPIHQIAEQLELSPGTVKVQLHRGRKHVEREVQKLEAKGVKLYGLSPLPFLLALLKRTAPAAETEQALLTGTLGKAGVLAETAAVQVGRGFFQTALGRVALGILTAAAIGGGIWGYTWVRDNLMKPMGDVQPTEQVETAEDLSTEPSSSETLPVESAEDLTTEPTTEPVTEPETTPPTEPASTEPAQTEPAAPQPANPDPKPTDHVGDDDHGDPEPVNPMPDPKETESGEASELLFSWAWDTGGAMNWNVTADENGYGNSRVLTAALSASKTLELYAEDENIVLIQPRVYDYSLDRTDTSGFREWITRQQWELTPKADGVTRIYCVVDDKVLNTLTVTVTTPMKLLSTFVTRFSPFWEHTEKTMENCVVGMEYELSAVVLGPEAPVFNTDNGSVVQLGAVKLEPVSASTKRYSVKFQIVGVGTAHVQLALDGKTEKTWTVHASVATVDYSDSQEDLIPLEAEPQVMSWYANTYSRPVLILQGSSESLYVKIKGTEPPLLTVDDPSVLSLSPAQSKWHEDRNVTEYWYRLTALHAGICTVTCSFGGKTVFTVPVVVP